jgi:hypothetical protein
VLKRTDSIPVKDREDAQGRCRPTLDPKPGHTRRRILRAPGALAALQMLAVARATAALCALPAHPMTARSGAFNCRI